MKKTRTNVMPLLTPIELAAAGEMPSAKGKEGKVIRFYAHPVAIHQEVTVDDLTAAGFVPFRFKGNKDPKTGWVKKVADPTRLVHDTCPVFASRDADRFVGFGFPVVRYEIGFGYEAKWGSTRFALRTRKELTDFLKFFNYPNPHDHKRDGQTPEEIAH